MTPDPRYPIGKFVRQDAYSAQDRAGFIATLEQLPTQMRAAYAGLNDAQLETPYRAGGWTLRQLAHHVPDSHANAYVRIKLALTEHQPVIKPYDEEAWAKLPDSRLPVDTSLAMLEAIHARWVALLRGCAEEDFARTYTHPESGLTTVDRALALYDWHSRHHLAHVLELKKQKGW